MKYIQLILVLLTLVYGETKLDIPPIKCNTVDNVIKGEWKMSDLKLQEFLIQNGDEFIKDFTILASTPLKEQSDAEYIRESVLSYSEYTGGILGDTTFPVMSEDKHLEMLKASIKHDLKYPKYKRLLEIDAYSYMFAYIKFLEDQKKFNDAYNLYIIVMERLAYIDKTVVKNFINGIKKIVINQRLKNALKESVLHNYYTKTQKDILIDRLKAILMLNESYWEEIMLEEKRVALAYMRIAVMDVKTFEDFLQRNNAEFEEELFEDIDRNTLKKFFENKEIMNSALNVFATKIDEVLEKLKIINTQDNYLNMEEQCIKESKGYGDTLAKKVGEGNKYRFEKQEFIEAAGEMMFAYSRSCKMGKSKTDYIISITKNKEFIDSL